MPMPSNRLHAHRPDGGLHRRRSAKKTSPCEIRADRGNDPDVICEQVKTHRATHDIPPKFTRKSRTCFSRFLYRRRQILFMDPDPRSTFADAELLNQTGLD